MLGIISLPIGVAQMLEDSSEFIRENHYVKAAGSMVADLLPIDKLKSVSAVFSRSRRTNQGGGSINENERNSSNSDDDNNSRQDEQDNEGLRVEKISTRFEKKIEKQMFKRGWDKNSVNYTIENPNRTVATRDTRWNPDGTRRDDAATTYIREDGHYVVRNDRDGTIVQISNRNKADWKSPFE